jgi:hypothetical protein
MLPHLSQLLLASYTLRYIPLYRTAHMIGDGRVFHGVFDKPHVVGL